MNDYTGKTCPYCKSKFTPDDDIVVCSQCEMPHHKDCWIENSGCTVFGCLGTMQTADSFNSSVISSQLDYEETTAVSANNEVTYCPQCGTSNPVIAAFCAQCGNRMNTTSAPPTLLSDPIPDFLLEDIVIYPDEETPSYPPAPQNFEEQPYNEYAPIPSPQLSLNDIEMQINTANQTLAMITEQISALSAEIQYLQTELEQYRISTPPAFSSAPNGSSDQIASIPPEQPIDFDPNQTTNVGLH